METGLCFSVPKEVAFPPSLKNIFQAIMNDTKIKNFKMPKSGDLTKWALQGNSSEKNNIKEKGVLLLNDILTVEEKKSESHKGAGKDK